VVAERQLAGPVDEHGQAVGRGDGHGERIHAGFERLLVEQPGAEVGDREHGQLLIGAVGQLGLDAGAQLGRGGGSGRQGEDVLGRVAPGQVGEAGGQRAGLARPRTAQDDQRAPEVGGRPALVLRELGHGLQG
jgi:hypothetical protein